MEMGDSGGAEGNEGKGELGIRLGLRGSAVGPWRPAQKRRGCAWILAGLSPLLFLAENK